MTDANDPTLDIPGLPTTPPAVAGALVLAVRATLDELHRQGHVNAVDVGKVQLALELAELITMKKSSGRASTVGNDARVLMEILDNFVTESKGEGDDMLRQAMDEWTAKVAELEAAGHAPVEPPP